MPRSVEGPPGADGDPRERRGPPAPPYGAVRRPTGAKHASEFLDGFGFELHPYEKFGADELRRSGMSWLEIDDEITLRAVTALGVKKATVPGTFPVLLADKLRAKGVELVPDQSFFVDEHASAYVDQICARFQPGQTCGVHEVMGLRRDRQRSLSRLDRGTGTARGSVPSRRA